MTEVDTELYNSFILLYAAGSLVKKELEKKISLNMQLSNAEEMFLRCMDKLELLDKAGKIKL